MADDQARWQRWLAQRMAGVPWNTIANEEGIHPNTFRDRRKKARQAGWVPSEEALPPAIRRDGKRVGVAGTRAPTPSAHLPVTAQEGTLTDNPTGADISLGHELSAPLSPDEVQTLEHYEQIIAQGIQTFVQVGHALLTIRDLKLYRQAYPTFEDYCRQRWDLSRPYAYQLMEASLVVENVSAVADIVPVNEAQARPLAALPAEQQREVWRAAVETAPPLWHHRTACPADRQARSSEAARNRGADVASRGEQGTEG